MMSDTIKSFCNKRQEIASTLPQLSYENFLEIKAVLELGAEKRREARSIENITDDLTANEM